MENIYELQKVGKGSESTEVKTPMDYLHNLLTVVAFNTAGNLRAQHPGYEFDYTNNDTEALDIDVVYHILLIYRKKSNSYNPFNTNNNPWYTVCDLSVSEPPGQNLANLDYSIKMFTDDDQSFTVPKNATTREKLASALRGVIERKTKEHFVPITDHSSNITNPLGTLNAILHTATVNAAKRLNQSNTDYKFACQIIKYENPTEDKACHKRLLYRKNESSDWYEALDTHVKEIQGDDLTKLDYTMTIFKKPTMLPKNSAENHRHLYRTLTSNIKKLVEANLQEPQGESLSLTGNDLDGMRKSATQRAARGLQRDHPLYEFNCIQEPGHTRLMYRRDGPWQEACDTADDYNMTFFGNLQTTVTSNDDIDEMFGALARKIRTFANQYFRKIESVGSLWHAIARLADIITEHRSRQTQPE
jgi:hypothetical protein